MRLSKMYEPYHKNYIIKVAEIPNISLRYILKNKDILDHLVKELKAIHPMFEVWTENQKDIPHTLFLKMKLQYRYGLKINLSKLANSFMYAELIKVAREENKTIEQWASSKGFKIVYDHMMTEQNVIDEAKKYIKKHGHLGSVGRNNKKLDHKIYEFCKKHNIDKFQFYKMYLRGD